MTASRRSSTDGAPDAEPRGAAGGEVGDRKLDDDRERVKTRQGVDRLARGPEAARARRAGALREGAGGRPAVGNEPEELLEIEVERIVAGAREHLHPGGAAEVRVDRT